MPLRSILILSYLLLSFPSGLFPSGFPTKMFYAFLIFPMRATCLAHLTLLGLVTLMSGVKSASYDVFSFFFTVPPRFVILYYIAVYLHCVYFSHNAAFDVTVLRRLWSPTLLSRVRIPFGAWFMSTFLLSFVVLFSHEPCGRPVLRPAYYLNEPLSQK
jgi:hypothetical protein